MIQERSSVHTMESTAHVGSKMEIVGQMQIQKDNKSMGSSCSSLLNIMSTSNSPENTASNQAIVSPRRGTDNLSDIITQALDIADDDDDIDHDMEKSSVEYLPSNTNSKCGLVSELQAEELLQDIFKARDCQLAKEQDLDKSIRQQLELAFARHTMGSDYGTYLTMKKVGRIRQECDKVSQAIKILETHAAEVVSKLEQALSQAWKEGDCEVDWASLDEDSMVLVDVSAQHSFEQEISDILSGASLSEAP